MADASVVPPPAYNESVAAIPVEERITYIKGEYVVRSGKKWKRVVC